MATSPIESENPLVVGTWNAFKGGYGEYSPTSQPVRMKYLVNAFPFLHADMMGISDSFRWHQDSPEELAQRFGVESAISYKLNDPRLIELGDDNGVALLSKLKFSDVHPIHLVSRQGLLATVEIENKPVQFAVVYLDDVSESCRLDQAAALVKTFTPEYPTVITGDLNTVNTKDFRLSINLASYLRRSFPRMAAVFIPKFRDMMKGDTLKFLESEGFTDAAADDPKLTTPTPLLKAGIGKIRVPMRPLFRLDYLLYRGPITIDTVKRHTGGIFDRASDHYPITGVLRVDNLKNI